ncbi:MAG: hypothetical protein MJ171_06910 [Clostridia bacterium]|nr:hypothetical protein [Clostridia bacterium]
MKKISKIVVLVLILTMVLAMTACGKKEEAKGTPAEQLVELFKANAGSYSDVEALIKKIHDESQDIVPIMTDAFKIEEGMYIEGFDTEITGYKNAAVIKSMMGVQPYIVYVFEVDNPDAFKKTLEDNANKRWNICTEADEMMAEVSGNFVFFVMAPASFDD